MKDKARDELLRSMTENLAILVGGTEAARPLRELEPRGLSFATAAVNKLEEYADGWPPGGGDGRGGGDENGRTYNLAASAVDSLKEREKRFALIREFDALIHEASRLLHAAADVATKAVVPLPSAPAKVHDSPDDWCASCARLKDHKGRPFAVPSAAVPKSPILVRRTPEGTTDATPGSALCAWCYGWCRGEHAWPPISLIEKRRDGVRITSKVLTDCGVVLKSDTPILVQ